MKERRYQLILEQRRTQRAEYGQESCRDHSTKSRGIAVSQVLARTLRILSTALKRGVIKLQRVIHVDSSSVLFFIIRLVDHTA